MKGMKKFEGMSFGERTKVVGESWGQINDDQKADYIKQAEEDKKRYEKELK